jgi:hypothetical protein
MAANSRNSLASKSWINYFKNCKEFTIKRIDFEKPRTLDSSIRAHPNFGENHTDLSIRARQTHSVDNSQEKMR